MHALMLLLVYLASVVNAEGVDFCFADNDEPYLYMGTKTAYHFVHGGKTRFPEVPNCQPVQVWMLVTHATRYPSAIEIERMYGLTDIQSIVIYNNETRGNSHMCNRDLENLKRWNPHALLTMRSADVLTPQGVEDMKLLARRLQSNFPDLLQPSDLDITSSNYKFRIVGEEFVEGSMDSFIEGLFGSSAAVTPEVLPNDPFLSSHNPSCFWNATVKSNSSDEERMKFDAGQTFGDLVRNISTRLTYPVTTENIETMYNMCRYEKAWSVTQLSPWCAVFSKEALRVLEYREDLYYYYKAGYGDDTNARLACPFLQDMIKHFRALANNENSDEPKGIFYFGDVMTLHSLLTVMGIAKDQIPLTSSNYEEMAGRQWRTSFISPFAGNLVAVFYKCNNNAEPNKVMFYLAEKPVQLEGCNNGLCNLDFLEEKFKDDSARCKMSCMDDNGAISNFVPSYMIFVLTCFSLVSVRY